MNYVKEYYQAIQQGDVVVSKKVERVYRFLVDQMNDPQCQYIFDERKADHAIIFIEHFCKHSFLAGAMAESFNICHVWLYRQGYRV